MEVDMIPILKFQGRGMTSFDGAELQSKDELQYMVENAMHIIGQKEGQVVHEDRSSYPWHGGAREESLAEHHDVPRW
jgi:hypothetical protein